MPMRQYTCGDYRQEMILSGWSKQLADPNLRPEDKRHLEDRIRRLEKEMGMDYVATLNSWLSLLTLEHPFNMFVPAYNSALSRIGSHLCKAVNGSCV